VNPLWELNSEIAPGGSAPAQEFENTLDMSPRDVSSKSRTNECFARQTSSKRFWDCFPAIDFESDTLDSTFDALLRGDCNQAFDPFEVLTLRFGQIGEIPEELGVEVCR
tara:strand:+ start:249 stop:575 length:327 start_codon:yes stop_codon:yes gene_type:complete